MYIGTTLWTVSVRITKWVVGQWKWCLQHLTLLMFMSKILSESVIGQNVAPVSWCSVWQWSEQYNALCNTGVCCKFSVWSMYVITWYLGNTLRTVSRNCLSSQLFTIENYRLYIKDTLFVVTYFENLIYMCNLNNLVF